MIPFFFANTTLYVLFSDFFHFEYHSWFEWFTENEN